MLSPDERPRDDAGPRPREGEIAPDACAGAGHEPPEQRALEASGDTSVWALQPLRIPADDVEAGGRWLPSLLATMRRRWRLLLAGALVGMGFGSAYLCFATPIYVVQTLLLFERRGSVFRDGNARVGGGPVATHAEIYQSPRLISEALRAIGVPAPEPTGVFARVRGWLRSVGALAPAEPPADPLAEAVLETVPELQASPVVGTDVVAVTLRTGAPERGVRLLDALTASYRKYLRDGEAAAQREGLSVLRERAAALEAQIASAAGRYASLAAGLGVLGEGEDGAAVRRMSLEEHERARADAERRAIDLENELAALRESPETSVAPSREIADELARAEASLAELRSRHTARHPAVRQAEQQVAGLREQIRIATARRAQGLERELGAARRTQAALAELQADEWKQLSALEAGRTEAGAVAAEIARLEEQRSAVLALLADKELSVLAAEVGEHGGTLVHVLEPPAPPPRPVWPLAVPVLLASGAVGLAAALGAALRLQAREGRRPARSADRVGDAGLAEPGRYAEAPPAVAPHRAPGF